MKKRITVPPKERWQQDWTDKQVEDICRIALGLQNECSLDDLSLWRSAENEFSTGRYVTRV